jgi:hypothetical protein
MKEKVFYFIYFFHLMFFNIIISQILNKLNLNCLREIYFRKNKHRLFYFCLRFFVDEKMKSSKKNYRHGLCSKSDDYYDDIAYESTNEDRNHGQTICCGIICAKSLAIIFNFLFIVSEADNY